MGNVTWIKPITRTINSAPIISLEKENLIKSLQSYGEKNAQDGVLKVEGGEIILNQLQDIKLINNKEDLLDQLSIDRNLCELLISNKSKGQVKVIFVTEALREWSDAKNEMRQGFINELILALPLKTAEFFERMILAMKLTEAEVIIYPSESASKDLSSDVLSITNYFNPELVITLGAKASSRVLKTTERLTSIHGQFFLRNINETTTFQVVPLFHPSIIETNLNMKKTAWADMQKIMKFLKKLP